MLLNRAAVLFDVDGTIAETEGDGHLPAFNQAFDEASLGWQWSTADYAGLLKITGGFERMIAHARRIGWSNLDESATLECFRRIHKRKNSIYAQRLQSGLISPRQGFTALVQKICAGGGRWAVVTTTSSANWQALWADAILPRGALPEPAVVICGEDVEKKKPDPQAYQLALDRLGLTPRQCLAIEDSRNGLIAACAAGIDTVVVRSRFFGQELFPEAIRVIDELSELV